MLGLLLETVCDSGGFGTKRIEGEEEIYYYVGGRKGGGKEGCSLQIEAA